MKWRPMPAEPAADAGGAATPAERQRELRRLQQALRQCQLDRAASELALAQAQQALQALGRALRASQARERRAQRDPLTGLPTRQAFDDQAGALLAQQALRAQGCCLLYIDLDGFKAVNDQLGHAAGDALLQRVGERLVQALREHDRVARHGGDEFICLLPAVHQPAQARAMAGTVAAVLARPCVLGALTVQVSASVGAALFPQDGHTLTALTERADRAMLWAKAQRCGTALAADIVSPAGGQTVPSAIGAHLWAVPSGDRRDDGRGSD